MDSSFLLSRGTLTGASEKSSPVHLLKYGIQSFREGSHAEGLVLFALARESLAPNQIDFNTTLDAFTQSHKTYSHAQEELLKASKQFAQADAEQQIQLVALENLLATLEGETAEDNRGNQLSSSSPSEGSTSLPALYITCFGRFEVWQWGKPIVLCSSRSGQSILRYLVAQPGHRATSDTLQTLLWPEEEPEVSQNKLHLAISALRRSLNHGCTCNPGCGYIVCKNQVYHLNPISVIRTDLDEFLQFYQTGRQTNEERIALYERACRLYTGPFLSEDRYADWSFLQREQLSRTYLAMCRVLSDHYLRIKQYEDAAKWATSILQENHCDEWAYRQLMHIFAAQGCRSEALQQYQRCQFLLREELGAQPSPETVLVFRSVLANEPPSYQ